MVKHPRTSAGDMADKQASRRPPGCLGAPFPIPSPLVPASLDVSSLSLRPYPDFLVLVPEYACSPACLGVSRCSFAIIFSPSASVSRDL